MKRNFKFRAWDEDGYMFTPSTIKFSGKKVIIWEDDKYFGELGSGVISLMQSTLMNDMNGKEIFEGDILEVFEPTQISQFGLKYEVRYKNGSFRFGRRNHHWTRKLNNLYPQVIFQMKLNVVGNIYENPELLEK